MRKPFVLDEGVKVVGPPGLSVFLEADGRSGAQSDSSVIGTDQTSDADDD